MSSNDKLTYESNRVAAAIDCDSSRDAGTKYFAIVTVLFFSPINESKRTQ